MGNPRARRGNVCWCGFGQGTFRLQCAGKIAKEAFTDWTSNRRMTKMADMENEPPTLLVVEDSEDDIFFMERIFKQLGARCTLKFVRDGIEAVNYLSGNGQYADRTKYPVPTIILMDLKMPRMNGFEVLEWMQKQHDIKLIPTIVVTSSTLQEDVTRAYRAGANAVMSKPVDKDSLLQMLKTFHLYWTDYVEMPEIKPAQAQAMN